MTSATRRCICVPPPRHPRPLRASLYLLPMVLASWHKTVAALRRSMSLRDRATCIVCADCSTVVRHSRAAMKPTGRHCTTAASGAMSGVRVCFSNKMPLSQTRRIASAGRHSCGRASVVTNNASRCYSTRKPCSIHAMASTIRLSVSLPISRWHR